jgi:pimeloyl-ACP methyl ester carboxylesterase
MHIFPTPTLGGKQFWADELWFRDWRIQRHAMSGRYRLVDPRNLQRASGTFAECRDMLEHFKSSERLPSLYGKGVIVLHGLIRSRSAGARMASFLSEQGDYTPIRIGYPSTRAEVDQHADCLAKVIENLHGLQQIDFVAHSLGNIVIRRYFARQWELHPGVGPDPRIGRMVMLGPPNRGARMAELFLQNSLFRVVLGKSATSLGSGWNELSNKLATPDCDFGIIAGGRGDARGFNPLLSGDDDMVVRVEETKLAGAKDFCVLPVLHTFLFDDAQVQQATLNFLRTGNFRGKPRTEQLTVEGL